MDEREALEIARNAVAVATANGAESAEATFGISQKFSVETHDTAIAKLEQSTDKRLTVRIFNGGRKSTLITSDLEPAGLARALKHAIDQAAFVAPNPHAQLPQESAGDLPDLHLYDAELVARTDEARVADAVDLERLIRASDSRVTNSGGSHYFDASSVNALANSNGFAGAYRSTRASRSTAPVAEDGDHKRTAHYGTASRALGGLESVEFVAATAARRAVEMFGARKPATMQVPVIFERDIAAAVLDDLFHAISAANVAVGNSWLANRIGDRIGSDLVTIVDDGRLAGALGSSPFDGEGVATRRTPVFERGVLKSFLFDSYYALQLGAKTTGNSSDGGIGPNTFYMEAGTPSLAELIAQTPRGVLVLDTIGFATEYASGTYSRGARGFYIENGELAYPIDEFTIAGHFDRMLAGIDGVASDLRFDGSIVSPSFRVAEMTVSGN